MQQKPVCSPQQLPSTETIANPAGQAAPGPSLSQPAGGLQSEHSSPAKKLEHSVVVYLTIISRGRGAARPIPASIIIITSATSAARSFMRSNGLDSF